MSDRKKKQNTSQKAQMQKKASTEKNNKNYIDISGYVADHESPNQSTVNKNKNNNRSQKKTEESREEASSTSENKSALSVHDASTQGAVVENHQTSELNSTEPQDQIEKEQRKKKKKKRPTGKVMLVMALISVEVLKESSMNIILGGTSRRSQCARG